MKKESLHIFINNHTITAARLIEGRTELIFSALSLSDVHTLIALLQPFHAIPLRIAFDCVNITIKSFDTRGMNRWHQYQLHSRLVQESKSFDWHCVWAESEKLLVLKGTLSDTERSFFEELISQKFLIDRVMPSLWILNKIVLDNHPLKQNGIVVIELTNGFQHILYLNGVPTIIRISKTSDTDDWVQFIESKHNIRLESLNINNLINSTEGSETTFPVLVLNKLSNILAPKINVSKNLELYQRHAYSNVIRQIAYGTAALSIALVCILTPRLFEIHTHARTITTLNNKATQLLNTLIVDSIAMDTAHTYETKRKVIESFNEQSFPILKFLEKISSILPNYGQVIYLRITPKISKLNVNNSDEFSVHVRIVPFKNSKNIQTLNNDLYKIFGTGLKIFLMKNPRIPPQPEAEPDFLRHAVQINMTGRINDL